MKPDTSQFSTSASLRSQAICDDYSCQNIETKDEASALETVCPFCNVGGVALLKTNLEL